MCVHNCHAQYSTERFWESSIVLRTLIIVQLLSTGGDRVTLRFTVTSCSRSFLTVRSVVRWPNLHLARRSQTMWTSGLSMTPTRRTSPSRYLHFTTSRVVIVVLACEDCSVALRWIPGLEVGKKNCRHGTSPTVLPSLSSLYSPPFLFPSFPSPLLSLFPNLFPGGSLTLKSIYGVWGVL